MKYRCEKHKTNEGFYDSEGKWHCWKCYKENEFFNPPGDIIDTYTKGDFQIRVLATDPHTTCVEVWNVEKKKLIKRNFYSYLSTAMRAFRRERHHLGEHSSREHRRNSLVDQRISSIDREIEVPDYREPPESPAYMRSFERDYEDGGCYMGRISQLEFLDNEPLRRHVIYKEDINDVNLARRFTDCFFILCRFSREVLRVLRESSNRFYMCIVWGGGDGIAFVDSSSLSPIEVTIRDYISASTAMRRGVYIYPDRR